MTIPLTRPEVVAAVAELGERGEALVQTFDYWRRRGGVHDEDIERLDITHAQINAWLAGDGWVRGEPVEIRVKGHFDVWRPAEAHRYPGERQVWVLDESKSHNSFSVLRLHRDAVNTIAHNMGHRGDLWTVLEEIAAMPKESA